MVPDSWVLILTETFRLHPCSLYDPWREPGASDQLVRDDSCSCSSWSAPLEQTNCRKTQNKPCCHPSLRALRIRPSTCPCSFTPHCLCCTLHGATTEHTKKRQPVPTLLAPTAPLCMMAEALHWDSLSLGEPSRDGAGLAEMCHLKWYNSGS